MPVGQPQGSSAQASCPPHYRPDSRIAPDYTGLKGLPLCCFVVLDRWGNPLPDSRVEVWHAGPGGGIASLRGLRPGWEETDSRGQVEFRTIQTDAAPASYFRISSPGIGERSAGWSRVRSRPVCARGWRPGCDAKGPGFPPCAS